VFAVVFFYLLMLLSFIDFDTMRLPNTLVLWLAGAGVLGLTIQTVFGVDAVPLIDGSGALANPIAFALVGSALGGLLPLSLSLIYQSVRGSVGLGMGDVKLLAVMGLFLGPYVLVALFAGSTVGALSALLSRGENLPLRKIPFGPFLAMGAILTAAFGKRAVGWYLGLL
jgi:leader peptidase (prepilin peptidase)/N-methyltransferase